MMWCSLLIHLFHQIDLLFHHRLFLTSEHAPVRDARDRQADLVQEEER